MDKKNAIKLSNETFNNDFNNENFFKFIKELFNKFLISKRDCTQYISKEYLEYISSFEKIFDYPITEIARESNVSYNSIKLFFPKLVESGIVIKTRKIGKSDYFKLNSNNIFVKNLIKLDWILTKRNILPEKDMDIAYT